MWPFATPINLIRYLIVWRNQASLIRLPPVLSVAISDTLGTMIAERLDAYQAKPWQKALVKTIELRNQEQFPDSPWPIQASILAYPGNRTVGQGEPIIWELKLFGADADHGFFLEVILPALEAASTTSDPRWKSAYSPWGNVAIDSVYVGFGQRWEPLVQNGRLDLPMTVSPTQWIDGQNKIIEPAHPFRQITWIMPFDLGKMPDRPDDSERPREADSIPRVYVPTVQGILLAMLLRATTALPDPKLVPKDVWQMLAPTEQSMIREALMRQENDTQRERQMLQRAHRGWPGQWTGRQLLARPLAPALLAYLNLAAILHIGRYNHYGCGTFRLR